MQIHKKVEANPFPQHQGKNGHGHHREMWVQTAEQQKIDPTRRHQFPSHGHKDLKFIEDFKDSFSLTPEKFIQFHESNLLRF